jgi:hypothetical protein
MTDRDDLLRRYAAANPLPRDAVLPDEVADGRPPLALLIKGSEAEGASTTTPRGATNVRWWRGPVVALAVVAVVLLVALPLAMIGGGDRPVEGDVVTDLTPEAWDPILSHTSARPVQSSVSCPETAESDTPGPTDQTRPESSMWSNQAAAFDQRTGRIVHIDRFGETWTFDVCTNTWHQMHPTVVSPSTGEQPNRFGDPSVLGRENVELVYDADSDRTVAIGVAAIGVYDANANTWTYRNRPAEHQGRWAAGTVYDPVSGLVIVQIPEQGLAAYDVDTDTWTDIGTLLCSRRMIYDPDAEQWSPAEPEPCYPFLIGYSAEIDELIFLGYQGGGQMVHPRTGTSVHLDDPPSGGAGAFGTFHYANGADGAYTFGEDICRLNPTIRNWTCTDVPDDPTIDHYDGFSARVGDPINDRLVLIDGYCCGGFSTDLPERHSNDVWALDDDTGELVELLAESGAVAQGDGS